jgi:hypothetical protein
MSHKVTAAYVTVRVPNELGQEVLTGFYEGAVLPDDVNRDDLDRHVRKGMVAEEGTPEAEAASPVGKPVEFDGAGGPLPPATPPPAGKPAGNASREAWAAHAAELGAPDEETRPVEDGGLSRDELRSKYGN